MVDLVNPLPWLSDLAEFFSEGARGGGLTIDAELCRAFADGVSEVGEVVSALVTVADAQGLVEHVTRPFERPRTPVERRRLAALAASLDPEGRVVAFPVAIARPVALTEGGSAA